MRAFYFNTDVAHTRPAGHGAPSAGRIHGAAKTKRQRRDRSTGPRSNPSRCPRFGLAAIASRCGRSASASLRCRRTARQQNYQHLPHEIVRQRIGWHGHELAPIDCPFHDGYDPRRRRQPRQPRGACRAARDRRPQRGARDRRRRGAVARAGAAPRAGDRRRADAEDGRLRARAPPEGRPGDRGDAR